MTADAVGALDGLVIADFGRVLAGPYATMILADLGAEVVKIERPGVGDDTRSWGPPWVGDESSYFLSVNRNKKSVTLDLREREDLESARELVRNADVVVQNFLPGTMDRLGLGYDAVREMNPRAVYCSISGFGGNNSLPGYDLLIQAVGGLMSITGPDPKTPTKVGVAVVDVITGLHASVGILAALRHRDRTGEGQHVEVNLLSSLLSALANQSSGYVAAGVVPQAMGNRHPSIAPYEVFDTADRPLVLAVGNDRQFSSLTEVLGVSELAADARFRVQQRQGCASRRTVRRRHCCIGQGLCGLVVRGTDRARCSVWASQRHRRRDSAGGTAESRSGGVHRRPASRCTDSAGSQSDSDERHAGNLSVGPAAVGGGQRSHSVRSQLTQANRPPEYRWPICVCGRLS